HRKSPTPRPIRQFGRCRRRGRHCGRPPASLRTSPGGTVRFNLFVLHDHVMVVLRPCEAKLSGLRCLTIIGTEGYPASTLLRGSPPLSGASVLSALRLEPLVPFPLASPARFSRSLQEPGRASRRLHAGCRSVSIRISTELIPKDGSTLGFDII